MKLMIERVRFKLNRRFAQYSAPLRRLYNQHLGVSRQCMLILFALKTPEPIVLLQLFGSNDYSARATDLSILAK